MKLFAHATKAPKNLLVVALLIVTFIFVFAPVTFANNGVSVNVASAVSDTYGVDAPPQTPDEESWTEWAFSGVKRALEIMFGTLFALVLWIPVFLSGLFMSVTALLFDYLLDTTVINFAGFFDENFKAGVDVAWTAFRDVGNILMIAMFVFVAFAVILNSQTYGLKQLGVRILVVALLINFSLFFTKAVVDVSNILAAQLRKEIVMNGPPASDGSKPGIASVFVQRGGLSSGFIGSATSAFKNTASTAFSKNGGVWAYAITATLFFALAGSIFLYASILLVTRMVMFLLLMITSPLAFVALMTPGIQKWWTTWWSTLLKNAIFAPFFVLLLWAVIEITGGIDGTESLFTQATDTRPAGVNSFGSMKAYFNVAIVLGLLYASTKIASELSIVGSKSIQNWGAKGLSTGLSAGLRASGLGAMLGLMGYLGRRTIGARGLRVSNDAAIRKQAVEGNLAQRMLAQSRLGLAKRTAGMSFDLRDAKVAKTLEKSTGVSLGKGVGSMNEYEKNRKKMVSDAASAAAEQARDRALQEAVEEAPAPRRGGTGDAANMARAIQESSEKSAQATEALSNTIEAQREERTASERSASTTDVSGGAETATIQHDREKQGELKGTAENIEGLTETINKQRQRELRATINKLAGGTDAIPTAITSSPEKSQTTKDPGAAAYKSEREAFLKRYEERGGLTQDSTGTRKRIAGVLRKEWRKTKEDRLADTIKKASDTIEKSERDAKE